MHARPRAQGNFWLDDAGDVESNATQCIAYLLDSLPRSDMVALFSRPLVTMDFLFEHVRLALLTRPWSAALGVPWTVFLDAVGL